MQEAQLLGINLLPQNYKGRGIVFSPRDVFSPWDIFSQRNVFSQRDQFFSIAFIFTLQLNDTKPGVNLA